MNDKTRFQQIIGLVLVVLLLAGCGGSRIRQTSDIEMGMPKNDAIESLGKPREWLTVTSDMQLYQSTYFDLESTKRSMPSDELWMFEYYLPKEGTFAVHFRNNEVVDVVKGALLKSE